MYFLAGAINSLRLIGAPAPVSARLASCHLDGLSVALRALPVTFQTIVAQIVPSYGGGGNPWANAWSWAPPVYQRLFRAALKLFSAEGGGGSGSGVGAGYAAPIPRSFEAPELLVGGAPPEPLPPGGRWWGGLLDRLSAVWRRDARDPWPRQSLDDGACELMVMRTLVQEAAAVGPRVSALGGVYRVAQPHDVRLKFIHPKPAAAALMPPITESHALFSDFLLPLPQALIAGAEASGTQAVAVPLGPPSGPVNDTTLDESDAAPRQGSRGSTRRAIRAALGQVVRSTAGRLRPQHSLRSAVLAPPEEEEEDDHESEVKGGAAGYASAAAQELQPPSQAPRRPSPHLKGYATVPLGSITPSVGGGRSQSRHRRDPGSRPQPPEEPSTDAPSASHPSGDAHEPFSAQQSALELAPGGSSDPASHSEGGTAARARSPSPLPLPVVSGGELPVQPLGPAAPESPPRAPPLSKSTSNGSGVVALLSTPTAFISRAVSSFVLRHRGGTHAPSDDATGGHEIAADASVPGSAPLTRGGLELLTPGAHGVGRGALLIVPMGGDFADTEPTFVQVDGEGYKVFALRRLELSFFARALMVSFK